MKTDNGRKMRKINFSILFSFGIIIFYSIFNSDMNWVQHVIRTSCTRLVIFVWENVWGNDLVLIWMWFLRKYKRCPFLWPSYIFYYIKNYLFNMFVLSWCSSVFWLFFCMNRHAHTYAHTYTHFRCNDGVNLYVWPKNKKLNKIT